MVLLSKITNYDFFRNFLTNIDKKINNINIEYMNKIKTRFAPSPTGYLHIGGARTALFNWLFAKHHNGNFVLRIEDTDQARSTKEYEDSILASLKWLGLNWDEGPYRQTERLHIYREYAYNLLKSGLAYYCFCSSEELEQKRKQAMIEKKPSKYDKKCRNLSPKEIEILQNKSIIPSIRFKIPETGSTKFIDLIRGEISFENSLLDDFIILRSNNLPTYNFTVVIDDILMEITHILRGEDHISNTPKQILLYQSLKANIPQFAHFPLILGHDKSPLSKRHGAVSMIYYQEQGYLSHALVNYLALLGWAYDDKQEFFSIDELVAKFNLSKVSKTGAIFNIEKLDWMNGEYIRALDNNSLTNLVIPYLNTYITKEEAEKKFDWIKSIVKLNKDRIKKLSDIVNLSDFFFIHKLEKKMFDKYKNLEEIFIKIIDELKNIEDFSCSKIENVIRKISLEFNLSASKIIHPLRVSLTGKTIGPGLFELMEILGKNETIKRLKEVKNVFLT